MRGSTANLIAEAQRRYRVAGMMTTMHSVLGDSYSRRAIVLDCVICKRRRFLSRRLTTLPEELGTIIEERSELREKTTGLQRLRSVGRGV